MRLDVRSKRDIGALLRANFLPQMVFCHPRFAVPGANGATIDVDHILVSRGGILLISVCPYSGTIENPFHGDWRQFYGSNIVQFRNPLERNTRNAAVISALLKQEKLHNIPISGIAVFPDNKTQFKNRIEQVMTVNRLVVYGKDMNKSRFLSIGEIHRTLAALRKYRVISKRPTSPFQEDR